MKVSYICLPVILFLISCASGPVTDEYSSSEPPIKFSRYISITTCYRGEEKCVGPVVKGLESANVEKKVKDISSIENVTLTDKPIKFENGEIRAQLTFGPPLKLSK